MTASIVITDHVPVVTHGTVERSSAFLATVFALSNFSNTGVAAWRWTLLDRPIGSAAALTSTTSATPSITPDIAGGYLVQLQTYTDAGATVLDDQDVQLIGIAFPTPQDWQVPAAGETTERGSRGWATPVEYMIRKLQTAIGAVSDAILNSQFAGAALGRMTRTTTGPATYAIIKDNLTAGSQPAITNDSTQGYAVGSLWGNSGSLVGMWICQDPKPSSAIWVRIGATLPNPLVSAFQVQDFLGPPVSAALIAVGIGALESDNMFRPTATGAGASVVWQAALQETPGHPGSVVCQTGTTNAGVAGFFSLFAMGQDTRGVPIAGAGEMRFRTIFNLAQLSTVGDEFKLRVGCGDSLTAPTIGVHAVYDRLTSVNWIIKSPNGAVSTTSSVAATVGWHMVEIVVAANGASAQVFMDGASLGTLTDTLNAMWFQPFISVVKSAGTTTMIFTADYFDYIEVTPARNV